MVNADILEYLVIICVCCDREVISCLSVDNRGSRQPVANNNNKFWRRRRPPPLTVFLVRELNIQFKHNGI